MPLHAAPPNPIEVQRNNYAVSLLPISIIGRHTMIRDRGSAYSLITEADHHVQFCKDDRRGLIESEGTTQLGLPAHRSRLFRFFQPVCFLARMGDERKFKMTSSQKPIPACFSRHASPAVRRGAASGKHHSVQSIIAFPLPDPALKLCVMPVTRRL
jgi:hypothetical protein